MRTISRDGKSRSDFCESVIPFPWTIAAARYIPIGKFVISRTCDFAHTFTRCELMEKLNSFTNSWLPNSLGVFLLFSAVQSLSTIFFYISDCDETFNYWEPTHFLQHNKGLQTWEYSPNYALRSYGRSVHPFLIPSYAYLYPQYFVGLISSLVGLSRLQQFYAIRFCLGMFCSASLTYFYQSISARRVVSRAFAYLPFQPVLSFLTLFFLLIPTGIFVAGTAYLPRYVGCFVD